MERRQTHRAPMTLEVQYEATNPTPKGVGKAVTRDVSRSGLALVTERPMTPRTAVAVELSIPGQAQPLRVKGEVMWQRNIPGGVAPTFISGVQFVGVDPSVQEHLDRFVSGQLDRHSQTVDERAVSSFDRKIRIAQEPWPIQMATLRTTHARIAATGAYLPETTLTNEDLIKQRGESLRPIILQKALGAVERRTTLAEETGADLMARAGKTILERASCDPKDLDRIICSLDPGDAVDR